jgi:hypothetical protein
MEDALETCGKAREKGEKSAKEGEEGGGETNTPRFAGARTLCGWLVGRGVHTCRWASGQTDSNQCTETNELERAATQWMCVEEKPPFPCGGVRLAAERTSLCRSVPRPHTKSAQQKTESTSKIGMLWTEYCREAREHTTPHATDTVEKMSSVTEPTCDAKVVIIGDTCRWCCFCSLLSVMVMSVLFLESPVLC